MKLKKLRIIKELDTEYVKEIKNKEITNRIRWIEHKEKPILYINYSNFLTSDETIKTILEVNDFIKKLDRYDILLLVDVRNSYADEKIIVETLYNETFSLIHETESYRPLSQSGKESKEESEETIYRQKNSEIEDLQKK